MLTENAYTKWVYQALGNSKVLVVAVINKIVGDFAMYVGGVEGLNHDNEFMDVAEHGGKLPKSVAQAIYPHMFKLYRWRD